MSEESQSERKCPVCSNSRVESSAVCCHGCAHNPAMRVRVVYAEVNQMSKTLPAFETATTLHEGLHHAPAELGAFIRQNKEACELLLQKILTLDNMELRTPKQKANRKKVVHHIQTLLAGLDSTRSALEERQRNLLVRTTPLAAGPTTPEQQRHIISRFHSPERLTKPQAWQSTRVTMLGLQRNLSSADPYLFDTIHRIEALITSITKTRTISFPRLDGNTKYSPYHGIDIISNNDTGETIRESTAPLTIARILHVLQLIRSALYSDIYMTKRSVYYTSPGLFGSQRTSDSAIEIISLASRVPRNRLHVIAAQKGLCSGNLQFLLQKEYYRWNCCETYSIPQLIEFISELQCSAKFALLVEKESIFQRLTAANVPARLNCVLVSGKGYPDTGTRDFLCTLLDRTGMPCFALVDCDPNGVDIFLNYVAPPIRRTCWRDSRCRDDIQHMGLHPFDVLSYPPLSACKKDLTEADVSLANKLLASEVVKHRPGLARLLKAMLKANAKLELESTVLADPEFLVETYLPNKLQEFGVFVQ